MTSELEKKLLELLDKEAIRNGILTYSRACDRVDPEAMASVFHDDAVYDHYQIPNEGGGESIANTVCSQLGHPSIEGMSHFVPNTMIELDGDIAYAETYGLTCVLQKVDDKEVTYYRGIRLLDRWERRDGKTWKIAYRTIRHDGFERSDPLTHERQIPLAYKGSRDKNDLVFHMRDKLKPSKEAR